MDTKFKNYSWTEYTKYENTLFECYDFTGTKFENSAFKVVTFKNCLFNKCNMDHIGLWNCNFIDCDFKDFDLRNVPFGAQGGMFKKCRFIRCDFRSQCFWSPFFEDCIFEKCKLKNINFDDASFLRCKFIGKLEDVTFNGMYHEIKRNIKPLDHVDFSESIFGDYVGFEDCDLSTCIPPVGKTFNELLYIVNLNKPKHLSTGSKDRYVIPYKGKTDTKNHPSEKKKERFLMEKYEVIKNVSTLKERIIIKSEFLAEGIDYAKTNEIKEIVISDSYKKPFDINVVTQYQEVELIRIDTFEKDLDLNCLSQLPYLNELQLIGEFVIDFSNFTNLKRLEYYAQSKYSHLEQLVNLEYLKIYNLKSDLMELHNMHCLKKLVLWDMTAPSLNGLSNLSELKELELIRAKKLTDITGIENSKKLELLTIHYSHILSDIGVLKTLKKLSLLDLLHCKNITDDSMKQIIPNKNISTLRIDTVQNLDFITAFHNLKVVCFDKVIDGDLSPLLKCQSLEKANFISRKTYNYSEKEVNQKLEEMR